MKRFLLITLLSISSLIAGSQIPPGYYDGTEVTGGDGLKTALYNIIKGHTEFPYTSNATYPGTDVWDILKESDRDLANPDNVIMLYSGRSLNAAQEWNSGNGWSREHVWSQSRGDFGTEEPGVGTDAHNLRPCEQSVNSAKSNRWFAECTNPYIDNGYETGSFTGGDDYWVWKPRDEVKGDVARMIFYMATRYEGENGELDLEVVDIFPADDSKNPEYALLSDLLKWHKEDPVDDYERARNEVIFGYQGNRNPFIDHPEFAECIWDNNCSGFWFSSFPDKEINDREDYSYNITATGGSATLTISDATTTLPAWLTFTSTLSETGNATATLTGSPEFTDIGTHTVKLNLSNGNTADDIFQEFEIVVTDGNPIAFTTTPILRANVDEIYTYNINASGDAGVNFSLTKTDVPNWLDLDVTTTPAILSGTPPIENVGNNTVILTLSDDTQSEKTVTQEFTINVIDPNDVNTVIITQYYEGESNNKHLELTNIGTETVDLSNYYLGAWRNLDTPSGEPYYGGILSGSIAAGETQVYKNASAALPADAAQNAYASTTATYFTGDDPIGLTRHSNTWEDRVDCLYASIANGKWGGETGFYRKAGMTQGNLEMSVLDGSGEWIQISIEDANNAHSTTAEYLGYYGESTLSVKELNSQFKLYPNPVQDILTIETTKQITKIEIVNLTGQIIQKEENKTSINTSELQKGVYFLKITEQNRNISILKFVKQ